jgi:hypothetical protein
MENLKKAYDEEKDEAKKAKYVEQYQNMQRQLEEMNAFRTQLMTEYVKRTEAKDAKAKEDERKAFAAARDQANALNNEVENIKKRITRLQGKADALADGHADKQGFLDQVKENEKLLAEAQQAFDEMTESFARYNVEIAREKKEELKNRVEGIDQEIRKQNAVIEWQKKQIKQIDDYVTAAGGMDKITNKEEKAAITKAREEAQTTLDNANKFVAGVVKTRENAVKVYKEEEEREKEAQTYLSEAAEKRAIADEKRFKKQLTADKAAFEEKKAEYDALIVKADDGTITAVEQTRLDEMEAGYYEAQEKYDQITEQVKNIEREAGQKAFEKAAAQFEDTSRKLKLAQDKARQLKK